ncbi:folylpolyglutamate synthase [Tieghemiomyces parasiticus]|uniref:Folylpolyglutamate synthase n=1 Tax=Tieghemiomyces parasiticus TaxID=78921 RepID=A0A9W8DXK2_9FUNG|nr:folylpolyglutamate synthase [Tieghemiomyces parasiticus]
MASLPTGINMSCVNLLAVLDQLDHPERQLRVIQVGGTNGKGSVCACLASILRQADYKVGTFNSPHLMDPRDSIAVNGESIPIEAWNRIQQDGLAAERTAGVTLTSFERLTLTAILWFTESAVALAILEVGMGGTRDATTVCRESVLVSILTAVGLDHVGLIGNNLEEIAIEKSGIFVPGRAVIIAQQTYPEVVEALRHQAQSIHPLCADLVLPAATLSPPLAGKDAVITDHPSPPTRPPRYAIRWDARVSLLDSTPTATPQSTAASEPPSRRPSSVRRTHTTTQLEFDSPLLGSFQMANFAAAVHAVDVLRHVYPEFPVSDAAIRAGMRNVSWPGRLETKPFPGTATHPVDILVDGAHNMDAAKALSLFVDEEWRPLNASILRRSAPSSPVSDLAAPVFPVTWIYACSEGKDPIAILKILLRPHDRLLLVPFTPPQGMPWVSCIPPTTLRETIAAQPRPPTIALDTPVALENVIACPTLAHAIGLIQETHWYESSALVLCGSLYLVSDYYREFVPALPADAQFMPL